MKMNRSQMLSGAAALALFPARPARAQAGLMVVRAAGGPVEEFALPYYAQQKGFFHDVGLDVQLQELTGGGLVTTAIVAGAIDCGVTNTGSMSLAHLRGLPIYLLTSCGVYTPRAPMAHLAVAKASTLQTARDLRGKKIGVTTLNDMQQAAAMAWIDKHGGDSSTASWIELRPGEMAPAIDRGRIDAGLFFEPNYSSVKDVVKVIAFPYESMNEGKPFQTTGSIANKDWADKNPDAARRWTRALFRTSEWANANTAEAATLLAALTKNPPDVVAAIPRVLFATKNDPGLIQPVIDKTAHYGFLPRVFPADQLYMRV
jgi:NitT/TauT family transport system substrate-binding protein